MGQKGSRQNETRDAMLVQEDSQWASDLVGGNIFVQSILEQQTSTPRSEEMRQLLPIGDRRHTK